MTQMEMHHIGLVLNGTLELITMDFAIMQKGKMVTNAERFKQLFGLYATELWSKSEKDFLAWLNMEYVPDTNVGELISRQSAIEITKMFTESIDAKIIKNHLSALPSVQPEVMYYPQVDGITPSVIVQPKPHWIPCSERLPEDGIECLVSVRCSKKITVVDMATYSTDLFKVDKEDFFGNRGESGWYCFNSEYGYCRVFDVIAWMPIIEPYQAEGKDDDE